MIVMYRRCRCEVMPYGIVMFCALHKVKLSLPVKRLRSKLHYAVTSLPQETLLA